MAHPSSPSSWEPPSPAITPTPTPAFNATPAQILNHNINGVALDENALLGFYRSSSNGVRRDMVTQIQSQLPEDARNLVHNEVLRMGASLLKVGFFPLMQSMNVPPDMVKRMLRAEFATVYGEELGAEVTQHDAANVEGDLEEDEEDEESVSDSMDVDPISADGEFEWESKAPHVHEEDPSEVEEKKTVEDKPKPHAVTTMRKFFYRGRLYEEDSLVVRLSVPSISAWPVESNGEAATGPLTKTLRIGANNRYTNKSLVVSFKFRDPANIAALTSY
ncbi:hypothetical protein K491DRAFT_310134 [Lophiostoma macrostomum CBS 122681]|uniref:Uncharacterized protein n=1 Tax=Lophiostoma macrostomum CBS 122681 TaxID=1314788 RepID=A0A6A6SHT3_9PLEO|nr:hypothetical protein K491DRAFT_310134 [Lophiostoma macrostomum CBS 122681]